VWKQQGKEFFEQAIVDADGTVAETTGECKQDMDVSYKGEWGYHPSLISLANTQEPLFLEDRSGNRPSQEGAAARLDQAIDLCAKAGFRRVLLRGDTDFSQTRYLDGWMAQGVEFIFGIDAMPNLVRAAEELEPQPCKTASKTFWRYCGLAPVPPRPKWAWPGGFSAIMNPPSIAGSKKSTPLR
jgi:hypothetical protein